MKLSEQDSLLKEILSGAAEADLRQSSLEMGLAAVRMRNKRRKTMRIVGVSAVALLLVCGALLVPGEHEVSPNLVKPATSQDVKPLTAQVRIISDEELLSLFEGRAVALIGLPGEPQQLVFLDGGGEESISSDRESHRSAGNGREWAR